MRQLLTSRITVLVLSLSILRLIASPFFGYGVDEAHYVLYAKNLALSYFDHPPLVGWTHSVFSAFIQNEFAARVPAILLGALNSFLIYDLLKEKDKNGAFLAVIALNGSLTIGVLFLTLMPDSLLITSMLLLLYAVKRLEGEKTFLNYLYIGLILGVAGLSKYTAVLLVPALFAYIAYKKRYDIIFNSKTLVSILVSCAVISPVLIWNIQNDFASFAFQASHVSGGDKIDIKTFFTSLGRQAATYNPALFLIAFFGLYKAAKNREFLLPLCIGVAVVLFMFYSQSKQVALPHWISPFFVLFIPIGTLYLYKTAPKTTKYIVYISLAIAVLIHLELIFKIGKFPDYKSPFRDIAGWDNGSKIGANIAKQRCADGLAVTNWSEASRVILYSEFPVFLLDSRVDQFDMWQKESPEGKNLLFINPKTFYRDINGSYRCDEIIPAGRYDETINGGIVDSFSYELCINYQGIR